MLLQRGHRAFSLPNGVHDGRATSMCMCPFLLRPSRIIPAAAMVLRERGFGRAQLQLQQVHTQSQQTPAIFQGSKCGAFPAKLPAASPTRGASSTAAPSPAVESTRYWRTSFPAAQAAAAAAQDKASTQGDDDLSFERVHTAQLQALLQDPSAYSLVSFRQLLLSQLSARVLAHSDRFESLSAVAGSAGHPQRAAVLTAALAASANRKVAAVEAFIRQCNERSSSDLDSDNQVAEMKKSALKLSCLESAHYAHLRNAAGAWHTLRAALDAEHMQTSAELRAVTETPGWWESPPAVSLLDAALDAHVVSGCGCAQWASQVQNCFQKLTTARG